MPTITAQIFLREYMSVHAPTGSAITAASAVPRFWMIVNTMLGRVPPTRNAWSAEMPEQLHVKRAPPSAAVALRYASNASMQPSIDGSAT